jgi:hypothetical protein
MAARTFGLGPLYPEGTVPLHPRRLFENPLWHPGKMVQKYNDCVIHTYNLLVGGPLIMSRQAWCKLYARRR